MGPLGIALAAPSLAATGFFAFALLDCAAATGFLVLALLECAAGAGTAATSHVATASVLSSLLPHSAVLVSAGLVLMCTAVASLSVLAVL